MPVYHFNVQDGSNTPDRHGTDLPNLWAARREGVMLAGRVLLDGPDKFWESTDWHVDVTNAAGLILFRLDFSATDSPVLVSANSNQSIRER
jgi:hypothetical protein